MAGLTTVATVPLAGWVGIVLMAALLIAATVQLRLFDRLGASLAGDRKRRQEALARTATPDGAERVARFASMLCDPDEVRTIRWTPARTTEGSRIVLGTSPMAWYLWLPEPVVLVRVPDSLIANMQQAERGDGVVELTCESRQADEYVTATDGTSIEEADNSRELAESLLSGLVIVDPNKAQRPAAHTETAPAVPVVERDVDRARLGPISIAS